MQDGTLKQRKGRNETGNNLTSTFNSEARKARILQLYKNNARIQSKQEHNAELQPNKKAIIFSTLMQVYLQDWRHTDIYTKKQRKQKPPA